MPGSGARAVTISMLIATATAGLFAGAAAYVTFVEHPARVGCGATLAIREFGPSYRRATVMQVPLAAAGLVAGVATWARGAEIWWLVGGVMLGSIVPFTLVFLLPTNRRLLDAQLDSGSAEAAELLARWGRLHAVRTLVSVAAFLLFVGLAFEA